MYQEVSQKLDYSALPKTADGYFKKTKQTFCSIKKWSGHVEL